MFLMIICYVDGQEALCLFLILNHNVMLIVETHSLKHILYHLESQCEVEAYHMPRYQPASHMAPSSAPPGKGIQGCQQNLSHKFHSVIFLGRILE